MEKRERRYWSIEQAMQAIREGVPDIDENDTIMWVTKDNSGLCSFAMYKELLMHQVPQGNA